VAISQYYETMTGRVVIHYNHKPDCITYAEYENNEYRMYVKCWCERIRPISVYMINFNELCSTLTQYKNKNEGN
jgi:hypothetical protein